MKHIKYLLFLLCAFAPLREAYAQRVALKQLERYLGQPSGQRAGYVGVTNTIGDQHYLKLDSIVISIVDTLIADSLEITDNDMQKIDTFYMDAMDSLKIKIQNDPRTWAVYLGDLVGVGGSDKQRFDTAVLISNILYLSIQRDSVPAVQLDLSQFMDDTDTDTDSQSISSPHPDSIAITRGNKIYLRENQYPDTFVIVGHQLRLSIKEDGMLYYSVDLSPYVNVTQVYQHSGTTVYQNTLSNGGGAFILQSGGATSISHNGTGTVTISSTDTDNYVDSLFFTEGVDTLLIGRTGALPDLKIKIPDDYADSLTWDKNSRILYIGRTGSLPTLSDTLDGIDTQRVLVFERIDDTVKIRITNDTTRYILLPASTDTQKVELFTISNDTLRIRITNDTTHLVKLSDTDHQYFDTAYILNDTIYLSILRDNMPVYKFDLKPYVDVPQVLDTFAIYTSHQLKASLSLDGQPAKNVNLTPYYDNQPLYRIAIGDGTTGALTSNSGFRYDGVSGRLGVNYTGSMTDNMTVQGTIKLINLGSNDGFIMDGIVGTNTGGRLNRITIGPGLSISGTSSNILSAIDQSSTNEIQTIDTFTIVGNTIRLSLLNDGQPYKSIDLSGLSITDTDDQYLDTATIVSNILRLSLQGDNVPFSAINLAPYLDNTDSQAFNAAGLVVGLTGSSSTITYAATGGMTITPSGGSANSTYTFSYTETDGSISNEGLLGVGAGGAQSSTITSNTSSQIPITINALGILSISETTGSNGGIINITATETDGSITNEAQSWTNTGGSNLYTGTLGQANGAGGGAFNIVGAGLTTVQYSAGTVTINTTAPTDNDNYVDAASFSGGTLTIGRTGILSDLTVSIPDNDNYVDAASYASGTLTIGRTGALADLTVSIPDNYVTAMSFASGVLTVTRNNGLPNLTATLPDGYVTAASFNSGTRDLTLTRNGALSALTVNIPVGTFTEVDGSVTNELQDLVPYIVSGDTLGFILTLTNDTICFRPDTAGFGGGGGGSGGGSTYTFSHTAGSGSLISTLNPAAGSIKIEQGTQIEVLPTASGIDGTAKIRTNFNGCPECVPFMGQSVGFTNDSLITDPPFKYWYDEGVGTLEAPRLILSQTNNKNSAQQLYISALNDGVVYTSGITATIDANSFFTEVSSNSTLTLPNGLTGVAAHYIMNNGFTITINRQGSETINGTTSVSFGPNDRLIVLTNNGLGAWFASGSNTFSLTAPTFNVSTSSAIPVTISGTTTPTLAANATYRIKFIAQGAMITGGQGFILRLNGTAGWAAVGKYSHPTSSTALMWNMQNAINSNPTNLMTGNPNTGTNFLVEGEYLVTTTATTGTLSFAASSTNLSSGSLSNIRVIVERL